MNDALDRLRGDIDRLDESILTLLEERQALASRVAELKKESGKDIQDPEREARLLAQIQEKAAEKGLPQSSIKSLWETLLEMSREEQAKNL